MWQTLIARFSAGEQVFYRKHAAPTKHVELEKICSQCDQECELMNANGLEITSINPSSMLVGVSVLVLLLLYTLHFEQKEQSGTVPLPPGPRGWPIIGNLLDFRTAKFPWVLYRDWAHQYGDLIYVKLFQTEILIINSADIALDLMDKRSSIYSDKPKSTMDRLMGWDWNMSFIPYGQRWRTRRRMFHQHFYPNAVKKYRAFQTQAVHSFLQSRMNNPGNIEEFAIRQTVATVIVEIMYGIKISSMDDEYVKLVTEAVHGLAVAKVPGLYWVEYLPILRHIPAWVPGAAARKHAAHVKPIVTRMKNQPFDAVKNAVVTNPCIVRDLLERNADYEGDPQVYQEFEENARDIAGIGYAAAVDTTVSLLSSCMCALAMRPELQTKARVELDAVVGPSRLPTFEDFDDLPFIEAIFMESVRWLPVLPLGVPHAVMVDDEYRGFRIPKGTTIVPNAWAMLHNPEDYPNPDIFDPDRFLINGKINRVVRDPATMGFGFGRRICPGRYLAKETALLTIASVLHVFDIVPATDARGQPVDPTPIPSVGIASYPDRLPALRPRSEAAKQLVRIMMTV